MEEELQCWSSDWLDHWNCSLLSFSVGSGGNRGLSWHDSRRCLHGNGAHTSEVCPASLLAPRMTAHDQRVQARGMGTQSGGRMQRLMRLNGNWSLGAAGVALQRTKPPPPWPSELKTFVMVNDVMSFVRGLCMLICVCVCVCVCVWERETLAEANLITVCALTEFNSISAFLSFPSLYIAYRINLKSGFYCDVCFEASTRRGNVFRATVNIPSLWLPGLRVKMKHECVEMLLLLLKPVSDWRAAFKAGGCSCWVKLGVAAVFT